MIYVDGVLTNTSKTAAESVQIVVSLLDETGNVVGTTSFNTAALYVSIPGQPFPFSMFINNAPKKWSTIKFQISGDPYDPNGFYSKALNLKTDKITAGATDSGYLIRGIVTNTGKAKATAEIVAILYSANGAVIAVQNAVSEVQGIAPGGDSPFELTVYTKSKPARYELYAQGF